MKISLFSFCLILFVSILKAQNAEVKIDRNTAEKFYHKAKIEFAQFEKQHGNFIQTKNVRMHYLTWGKPTGIPLIWSHGSLLNAFEISPIADNLAKAGYYVIAIDYYGHGLTGFPDHEVSIYHIADDIKFLMDKLKIKKAVIGGFSRGGYISAAFYDSYPASVLGLILEDGGSVSANTQYHRLSDTELKSELKEFDTKNHNPWDTTYNTEFDAYYSIYDNREKGNQFQSLALLKKNNAGKWGIYSGLINLFHMSSSQDFMDLILRPTKVPLFAESMIMMEPKIIFRNLNVPVLILDPVNENDPRPFEKENEALHTQFPKLVTHVIYPNIEHNILYAAPKKFTKDVIDFLQKIKADKR